MRWLFSILFCLTLNWNHMLFLYDNQNRCLFMARCWPLGHGTYFTLKLPWTFSFWSKPVRWMFFPPASAVEGMESVSSVCVSVWVSVNTLTAEPFDIWSQNLMEALTLIISWMSYKVKVKGQGHQVEKRESRSFRWFWFCKISLPWQRTS